MFNSMYYMLLHGFGMCGESHLNIWHSLLILIPAIIITRILKRRQFN